MKRRYFLKTLLPAGYLAGSILNSSAQESIQENNILVRNGTPVQRFQNGIEVLGGLTRFVKKGQRVVIKPTMAFNQPPETGFNSNPQLVKDIIDGCYFAGAKSVSIFDHTIDDWTKCYKNSGIERVAKDARARVLPANYERFFQEINSSKPDFLKSVKIHQAFFDADVFINVAAISLDSHNFFGSLNNIAGGIWERQELTTKGNELKLCELLFYLKPDLTIADGKNFQVLSTNCITADSASLACLGKTPEDFIYLKYAEKCRLGNIEKNIEEFVL